MIGLQARTGIRQNPQGSFAPAHSDILHGETQRLDSSLEMESARLEDNQDLADLEAKLEEMELRLKKQEALKERLINEAEEAKRELERVEREEKFSDPADLNATDIASKFYNVKDMKKKTLQQEFEDLKVAHLFSREASVAGIQAEREKREALQEELYQLQTYYEELSSTYEADDALVRQEADTQKFHEARLSEEQWLLENLRTEKDDMFLEMSHKIAFLQDNEKLLQEELTRLKRSYSDLNCKYDSEVYGRKQDVERYRQEATREKDANLERENKNLQLVNNLRAEKEEPFQKMAREILILRKREKQMRNELDQVHVSHKKLKSRYNTDTMDLKQQVDTYQQQIKQDQIALSNSEKKEKHICERNQSALQQQFEKFQQQVKQERKAHLETSEKDKERLDNLRAEYAVFQQNTTAEIQILLEKESSAQAELEKVNGLYLELKCRYETEVTALKQQAEKYQEEISCVKNDLQRAREDLLLPNTPRVEKEDFQQNHIPVSQEKEEDSQDPVEVLSEEVSSEEKLSGEPLSGSSTDPESSEETEIAGETVLEDLDNPDIKIMQDGKKKKSKISFWKKVRKTLRWKKPKKKQMSEDNQEHV